MKKHGQMLMLCPLPILLLVALPGSTGWFQAAAAWIHGNLWPALVALFLFGVTIFVHELGHFLTARWCGMVVEVFSIGFGPALWKRKINGVVYKIGILPFGGYVSLPQMDSSQLESPEGNRGAVPLPAVSPWKRIAVSLAGVFGNIVFAFLLACLIYVVGKPSSPAERDCIVGYVATNSAAWTAGIRPGDDIQIANGKTIRTWEDLLLTQSLADQARLSVRHPSGEVFTAELSTEKNWIDVQAIPGIGPINFCRVAQVIPDSSAAEAGLRSGDWLTDFNGQKLYSREHLIQLVNRFKNQSSQATVVRAGKTMQLAVTPKFDPARSAVLIGVIFDTMDIDYDATVHPRPWAQIRNFAAPIFHFLKALVTPSQSRQASQAAGGPITILIMYWLAVKSSLVMAIWFTIMLNVNLAIINILPLPVLDGGHVMFALWEGVTRRKVHPKVSGALINFFAVLLIGTMLLLTVRDVRRWFFGGSKAPPAAASTNAVPPGATTTNR